MLTAFSVPGPTYTVCILGFKKEVTVDGMVTGLTQLTRKMRLSLRKPPQLSPLPLSGTSRPQACVDVPWAFRGDGGSRAEYVGERLFRKVSRELDLEECVGFL